LRPLLWLAWPVLVEQLLNMLVGVSDKWLTGNYLPGDRYLAAMTVVGYLLWFLTGLFAAVSIAATALVSRMIGAKDEFAANRALNQALTLGVLLTLVAVAIAVLLGPRLIALLGLEPEAAELARRYFGIFLPALPAIMISQVGIAALRGAGDTVTGLVAMIFQNAVNILVGFSLVRGWGPIARLGWDGLAIGAACGFTSGALVVLARLLVGHKGLRIRGRMLRPDFGFARRLLRIGIPGGADVLAASACQFWFLAIVMRLRDTAAAAHGIAITVESFAYLPGSAFQVAATTLVGQYLGARDQRRAVRAVWVAVGACAALMTLVAVSFYLASEWFARRFAGDGQLEVAALAAVLIRIVAFGQTPQALLMVLTGALRGAGETRGPLVLSFLGFLAVRIPLAYWLAWDRISFDVGPLHASIAGWGMGVRGAWYAMVADLCVRAVLIFALFQQGRWQRIQV
jgi:putative MATE family efflux protein